jgi:hypothetical protein
MIGKHALAGKAGIGRVSDRSVSRAVPEFEKPYFTSEDFFRPNSQALEYFHET